MLRQKKLSFLKAPSEARDYNAHENVEHEGQNTKKKGSAYFVALIRTSLSGIHLTLKIFVKK